MKTFFRDIWRSDRRGFLSILALNIAVSSTVGFSIAMLLPMLELLDVPAGESFLPEAVMSLPYPLLITAIALGYVALITAKALLGRLLAIRQAQFQENYTYSLRIRLYDAFTHASYEQLNTRRQTDTINLFTTQCSQVSGGVANLISLISSGVSAAVQVCVALAMSVPVTLLVMACGVVFLLGFKPLRARSKACGENLIQLSRQFYGELYHQLASVKEIRTYGVEEAHAQEYRRISGAFRDAYVHFARLRAFPNLVHAIAAAAMVALVFLVSILALDMPTARLMVLVYTFSRLWPLFSGLQGTMQSLQSAVPAYELLDEAVRTMRSEATEVFTSSAPVPFTRDVRFENVGFTYRDAQEPVLQDVNFTIRKGSVVALTGRSGEGKSTTADLLLGFLHPTQGRILVDGLPLTQENMAGWRRQIGYVPQMPSILNATVRENLQRFHPAATEEQMIAALKRAQAWPFISKMPDGLDTLLGDRGVRLSGGERQRLVLARVLLDNPDFILLDEATSSLDFESECAIRDVLYSLKGETTILIIAHRLATIRIADQAIVLGNRTVDEYGPLSELLARQDGYLARMLNVE